MGQVGDPGERVDGHGEVVVLAGDLDRAGRQVLDRVVGAVVAERQLDRLAAECPAEQLVTEADAEDRHPRPEQVGDDAGGAGDLGRVAGTVGQEDPVGLEGECVGGGRRRRHDLDHPQPAEVAQDRALDAVVVGHDAEPAALTDRVPLGRRHRGHEVDTVGPGLIGGGAGQRVDVVGGPERSCDRPRLTDQPRQPPGVDAGDAGDAYRRSSESRSACDRRLLGRRASSRTTTPRQNRRLDSKSVALTP